MYGIANGWPVDSKRVCVRSSNREDDALRSLRRLVYAAPDTPDDRHADAPVMACMAIDRDVRLVVCMYRSVV